MFPSTPSQKLNHQFSDDASAQSSTSTAQTASNAHRKSAVERLEESKAHYVKTESVLDCKQRLEHASHLQVPTRPQVDVFLISSTKISSKTQPKPAFPDTGDLHLSEVEHESLGQPTESRHLHRVTYNIFKATKDDTELQCNCSFPQNQYHSTMSSTNNTNLSHQTKSSEMQSSVRDSTLIFNSGAKMSLVKNAIRNLESSGHYRSFEALEKEEPFPEGLWRNPPNGFYSESEGHSSGEESKDSSLFEVLLEREDPCPLSKTSDYVSRSSSFKCNVGSDRVKSLVSNFEAKMNHGNCYPSQDLPAKRTVARSKSDVGHKFAKNLMIGKSMCSNNNNNNDLERFFDSMGLDTTVWRHLNSRPLSPARFFDSISSLNSEDHHSSVCSEESESHREGLTNKDLQRHGPTDTSIVEKNARVVKWLYNCRNTPKKAAD